MKFNIIRRIWQLVVTLGATSLAVYTPINIVFRLTSSFAIDVFYWVVTILFAADIIFNLLFPQTEISRMYSKRELRIRYIKSWFIIDLISAIPFTPIFTIPTLGILRLVKLIKVGMFFHSLRQRAIRVADYLLLGFFIFWLFLFAHWLACGWIYIRNIPDPINSVRLYLTSLYWVIETLTTIGYGETTPATNLQYVYSMIIMLAGVGVYGFIIGNVANLLSKRNPARNQFFNNLEQLKVFVNYRKIPFNLQKKISDYYSYIWKKKLGFDESVFISGLPQGLQNEVSVYLKRDILEKISLFSGVSDNFLRDVSLHMRPIVCVPGECVFKENDPGNEMYFVIRGKLEVIAGQKIIAALTDGDFFGEIALFTEQSKRTATVKSITYSDLYRLDRELFVEVLKRYPSIAERIKKTANERLGTEIKESS